MSPHGKRYILGWINVTHVCPRWRSIALNMASFWARDVCNVPEARDVVVRRARNFPLKLQMGHHFYPGELYASMHRFIVEHIPSARDIDVMLREGYLKRLLDGLVDAGDLSKLEALSVKRPADGRFERCLHSAIVAPRLRTCVLGDCFVPLNALHLTHLDLSRNIDAYEQSRMGVSVQRVLHTLRTTPRLQRLRISDYFSYSEGVEGQVVNLQELQELSIFSHPSHCITFLKNISFPPSLRLRVGFYIAPRYMTNKSVQASILPYFRDLFSLLSPLLDLSSPSHSHVPTALSVAMTPTWNFHVNVLAPSTSPRQPSFIPFFTDYRSLFDANHHSALHLAIINWIPPSDAVLEICTLLSEDFGTAGTVKKLEMSYQVHGEEHWKRMTALWPDVEEFYMSGYCCDQEGVSEALKPQIANGMADMRWKRLRLWRLAPQICQNGNDAEGNVDAVATALEMRAEHGMKLPEFETSHENMKNIRTRLECAATTVNFVESH
ncbi:hypothetical protein OF83DRAFT_1175421 [Amylostereum chailletii]|nr:hypothetical protein OF83DRAFT_1175421 [Amylostereum chailletii]